MNKKEDNSLIFIGTIKKVPNCGESMKNHLFIERFKEVFDRVKTIGIFHPKKHPICFIKIILVGLFHRHEKIILSVSPATGDKFVRLLLWFGCDNIYYWAVGISLMDYFIFGRFEPSNYNKLKAIFVQSPQMVEKLTDCGVRNVRYVPNSKRIDYFPKLTVHDESKTKFVFLSRIHPQKGCEMIINCARRLEGSGYADMFSVDFYGQVFPKQQDWFEKTFTNLKNVQYLGFLDLRNHIGYDILEQYDAMLFPTFYDGEAFPGVIIDSFISGLPVISSDWHFNTELIDEKVGIIIPAKDENALYDAMLSVIKNKTIVSKLRVNCQQRAKLYDNKEVLSVNNLKKIGLL